MLPLASWIGSGRKVQFDAERYYRIILSSEASSSLSIYARCPLSSIIVGAKTALSPPSRNSHPRTNRPKRDGGPALTNLTASAISTEYLSTIILITVFTALASHHPPPPLRPPLCLRPPPT
ncbi:hypothetical protein CIRG_02096 [Coccidioides immitis RMSCC 2394]|uniref:Uncharacterized protein n=1 Tax=Coccidioides immitis RMSCC 2394 TaxID=404692 RepID=A0A0J7AX48_COCIT|nr:hypothetical protein CIRG_02096 [Coccidioides immitis RMSCC 2394]